MQYIDGTLLLSNSAGSNGHGYRVWMESTFNAAFLWMKEHSADFGTLIKPKTKPVLVRWLWGECRDDWKGDKRVIEAELWRTDWALATHKFISLFMVNWVGLSRSPQTSWPWPIRALWAEGGREKQKARRKGRGAPWPMLQAAGTLPLYSLLSCPPIQHRQLQHVPCSIINAHAHRPRSFVEQTSRANWRCVHHVNCILRLPFLPYGWLPPQLWGAAV